MEDFSKPPIILASASPRRLVLLRDMGLKFSVQDSKVKENHDLSDPHDLVLENANLKAKAVSSSNPSSLVIGADTTVFMDGKFFHKPRDLNEAYEMLVDLSGKTHHVHTGVSLQCLSMGWFRQFSAISSVTFKVLSSQQIKTYMRMVNPLDKAGAYGIQNYRNKIIDSYSGTFSSIMGMPVELLTENLKCLGYGVN